MLENISNDDKANPKLDPHSDYSYYEEKCGNSKNRRCIDGHITGSGNCVGYCMYDGHIGFLTKELREGHNCIENGCFYYLQKGKTKKPQVQISNRSSEVVKIASDMISAYEGIRIMDASIKQSGGWFVKYVSITNVHSIEAIEDRISTIVGESITMVNLNYSFERTAQLIFAKRKELAVL